MSAKAVLYLRSSKDRHDVSIDAQRDELRRLATARNLDIVREFVDVVESAKDEHRPAFQELRAALKARDRDWTVVILLALTALPQPVCRPLVHARREAAQLHNRLRPHARGEPDGRHDHRAADARLR